MRNTKKRIKRNKRRTRKYSSSLTGGNNTSSVSSNTSPSSGSKGSFFRQGLTRIGERAGLTRKRSSPAVENTVFHPNIVSQVTEEDESLSSNDLINDPRRTIDVPSMHIMHMQKPVYGEQKGNEGGGGGGGPGPEGRSSEVITEVDLPGRQPREALIPEEENPEESNPLQPQPQPPGTKPQNPELNPGGTTDNEGVNVTTRSSNTVISAPSQDNQEKSMSAMQKYYKTLELKDKLRVKEILNHLCKNLDKLDDVTSGAPIIETGPATTVFSAEKPKKSMYGRLKKGVANRFFRKRTTGNEPAAEQEEAPAAQEEAPAAGSSTGDDASGPPKSTMTLGGKKKRRHTFVRRKKKGKKRKKRTKTKKRLHKKR